MGEINQRSAQALSYGCRSWLYLMLNFVLGILYFYALVAGFSISLALSIIWVGIPLLALMFATTRRVAVLDRWLAAKMLNLNTPPLVEDLPYLGINPLRYVAANFTSASTWGRIVALFLKLPLGIVSFGVAWLVLPFFVLEAVVNLLGLNTGMATGRLLRAMAAGLSGLNAGVVVSVPARDGYLPFGDDDDAYADAPAQDYTPSKRKTGQARAARAARRLAEPQPYGDDPDTDDPLYQARPVKRKRSQTRDGDIG